MKYIVGHEFMTRPQDENLKSNNIIFKLRSFQSGKLQL